MSDAVRYGGALGIPGCDNHEDWLHSADGSGQHRRSARTFFLGKSAAHLGTQPGAGGAASGSAAAQANPQTQTARVRLPNQDRGQDTAAADAARRIAIPAAPFDPMTPPIAETA